MHAHSKCDGGDITKWENTSKTKASRFFLERTGTSREGASMLMKLRLPIIALKTSTYWKVYYLPSLSLCCF